MIEQDVLRQLKKKAAEEGRTRQGLANDLLRYALRTPRGRPYKLHLQGWKAELQPAVALDDLN